MIRNKVILKCINGLIVIEAGIEFKVYHSKTYNGSIQESQYHHLLRREEPLCSRYSLCFLAGEDPYIIFSLPQYQPPGGCDCEASVRLSPLLSLRYVPKGQEVPGISPARQTRQGNPSLGFADPIMI